MSKKDAPSSAGEPQRATVELKPILGVRPGIYLTVIYGLILVLVVFFVLFYPGLRNRGSYISIDVRPGYATVKVDGVFAGTAPSTIFVKNGSRKIEVGKAFFSTVTKNLVVHGRVFATLFVPSRQRVTVDLSIMDLKGLVEHAVDDFSRNPSVPQIVSDTAWAAYGKTSYNLEDLTTGLYDFVDNCMYFMNPALDISSTTTTAEKQLVELLRAGTRISSFGTFLTPSNFISFVNKSIQIKEKYENSPSWLLLALSREHGKSLTSSNWLLGHFAAYRNDLSRYYQPNLYYTPGGAGGGAVAIIGGVRFRSIPPGTIVMGKDDNLEALGKSIDLLLPHPVSITPFYLSETEVTNRQYKLFLDDTPKWRHANLAMLVQVGLVSDGYLSDWLNDLPPAGKEDMPLTTVSYDAASAYCEWLTQAMHAQFPGMIARLPAEVEWEWAARGGLRGMPYPLGEKPGNSVFFTSGTTGPSRAGSSEPNGYGLRDMMGNVWEWCGDSFAASDYLLSSLDPRRNTALIAAHPVVNDKAVRGGAWNNQKDVIKVYTRGSQPRDWCSPFLGFRVAVASAAAGR
jgi:iron(II)-dependent oxidoreductase